MDVGLGQSGTVAPPVMRLSREGVDDGWPDPDEFDWGVETASTPEPARRPAAEQLPEPATEPPPSAQSPTGAAEAAPETAGEAAPETDETAAQTTAEAAPDHALQSEPTTAAAGAQPKASRQPGDGIFPALDGFVTAYRVPTVIVVLAIALVVSLLVPSSYSLRSTVVALHLVALVVSFGAVLLLDWHGILWLAGQRRLGESVRLAAAAEPLIWAGLLGLVLTGALLRPDLSSPLVVTKLILAAAVVWNTAGLSGVRRRLAALPAGTPPGQLPQRERRLLLTNLIVSQLAWWGAVVLGFVTYSS